MAAARMCRQRGNKRGAQGLSATTMARHEPDWPIGTADQGGSFRCSQISLRRMNHGVMGGS